MIKENKVLRTALTYKHDMTCTVQHVASAGSTVPTLGSRSMAVGQKRRMKKQDGDASPELRVIAYYHVCTFIANHTSYRQTSLVQSSSVPLPEKGLPKCLDVIAPFASAILQLQNMPKSHRIRLPIELHTHVPPPV